MQTEIRADVREPEGGPVSRLAKTPSAKRALLQPLVLNKFCRVMTVKVKVLKSLGAFLAQLVGPQRSCIYSIHMIAKQHLRFLSPGYAQTPIKTFFVIIQP